MARRKEPTQPVRKSFLVFGGIAVGAALFGFVLMTFVLGGGGGDEAVDEPTVTTGPGAAASVPAPAATPKPTEPPGLRPGGRDPFARPGAAAAPAVVQGTSVAAEEVGDEVKVSVLKVYEDAADLKINKTVFEGVKAGQKLTPLYDVDEIDGECVYMKQDGERFKVCVGTPVVRK